MVNLQWNGDDFRNSKDSSGTTADLISHSGKLQQGYKHGSLTEGLVAYYPMEKGEGEVLHDGALDNLGQINGATWNSNNNIGNYTMSFDGGSDYVSIPAPSNFSSYTISLWAYARSSNGGEQDLVALYNNNEVSIVLDHPDAPEKWRLQHNNNGTWYQINSNQKISEGTWYHIVGRWNGDTLELYIDGSSKGSTSVSGIDKQGLNSDIGTRSDQTSSFAFDGLIEDVRIYNRILSRPEIQALYNLSKPSGIERTENNVPSQDQAGISRYKLDGDVTDSWSSNNGSNNGATFNKGVYNQAGTFNGSSDYIETGVNLDNYFTSAFSLSAWVKPNSISNDHMIIGSNNSNDNQMNFRIRNSSADISTWDGSQGANAASSNLSTNEWYHLIGTYDSNKGFKIYVNGRLEDQDSSTLTFENNTNEAIGRRNNDSNEPKWFDGKIDDVRIYNTALTPQQVEQLYHKGAYRVPRRSTLQ